MQCTHYNFVFLTKKFGILFGSFTKLYYLCIKIKTKQKQNTNKIGTNIQQKIKTRK